LVFSILWGFVLSFTVVVFSLEEAELQGVVEVLPRAP
jgi:hypothetical protein